LRVHYHHDVKNNDTRSTLLSPCQIVAWNLERIRRKRRWSQEEAAVKLEPYLGYRLSRAAFSQAEQSLAGKRIRRFDADEIVAFARAFDVHVPYFFCVPAPHFGHKAVVVNGKPGKPRARVTSRPLARPEMLVLAQGLPKQRTLIKIAAEVATRQQNAIAEGVVRYLRERPDALLELLRGRNRPDLWERLRSHLAGVSILNSKLDRNAISEDRLAQEVLEALREDS
jgi:hypothetical protein